MKPINFNEVNVVIAKEQPQYLPLPANVSAGPEGIVITCWSMTFTERLKALWTGKIWVQQMAFGKPLQPQKISVEKP